MRKLVERGARFLLDDGGGDGGGCDATTKLNFPKWSSKFHLLNGTFPYYSLQQRVLTTASATFASCLM